MADTMEEHETAPPSSPPADVTTKTPQPSTKKGWRFWAIFPAILITTLLAAVESTVTSTALPFIVHDLDAGDLYVWFVNVYFLTSAAFLPLLGQMANLFGRRWMMIGVVATFALGSGISGGSINSSMLIAGRAIQGIGGGGINLMVELVISDLIPLRERGSYMAIVFLFFAVGTSLGPFIGGAIVDNTTWRWVFYINLPIAGVALVLHLLFLRVKYDRETAIVERLKKIDYAGNLLLIGSVVSVLIALSWGGSKYSWASYQVLLPLLLGVLGLAGFHWYETMPWVKNPTLPSRVFTSRTAAAALILAFLSFLLLFWAIYFLPVYFQAVLLQSPTLSGASLLPMVMLSVLTGVVAGIILTKTGRYKPIHLAAFLLIALGLGLFAHFDEDTSTAEWVLVQIVAALGLGLMTTANLPAVQADLPESDTAVATGAFAFMRAYGSIWGISIPAAIFNAKFESELYRIDDANARSQLSGGDAYSFANADLIRSFPDDVQGEIIDVYVSSLRLAWLVTIAFSVLGFLLCFVEKEIPLRTELDTEYGFDDKGKRKSPEEGPSSGDDRTKEKSPAQEAAGEKAA